jgi:molybdopterin molybdotransferase
VDQKLRNSEPKHESECHLSKLISFEDALSKVRRLAVLKSSSYLSRTEFKKISEALGRVCSEDVLAREPVPHFNNSSMDGFAVRSEETRALKHEVIQVRGRILAGDPPLLNPDVRSMSCYEIMTGAPIPDGYDAVYKVEDVQVEADSSGNAVSIRAGESLEKFQHYRHEGEDFSAGEKVLEARTLLMPEQIMALASVGVSEVNSAIQASRFCLPARLETRQHLI